MESAFDTFSGFDIAVATRHNERGAWVADLSVSRDGKRAFDTWPEPVQPEWRTPEEAIRDGIERARRVIRQHLVPRDDQSWIAARERSQSWFSDATEHASGVTFTRGR